MLVCYKLVNLTNPCDVVEVVKYKGYKSFYVTQNNSMMHNSHQETNNILLSFMTFWIDLNVPFFVSKYNYDYVAISNWKMWKVSGDSIEGFFNSFKVFFVLFHDM